MFSFFSAALRELSHISWPTQVDMKRYMSFSLAIIVVATVFLLIVGTLFTSGMYTGRDMIRDRFGIVSPVPTQTLGTTPQVVDELPADVPAFSTGNTAPLQLPTLPGASSVSQ